MRLTLKFFLCGFILMGSAAGDARAFEFNVTHTMSNYRVGKTVILRGAKSDRGENLPLRAVLVSGENPFIGATSGGLDLTSRLPEWVEFRWIESGPDSDMSSKAYYALSKEDRRIRAQRYAALPEKAARIEVARHIPVKVIEELRRSPIDPNAPNLPLKTLSLYFVWTGGGVKFVWRVFEKCCDVLYEGGDSLMLDRP